MRAGYIMPPLMKGATAGTAGRKGLVPKPAAGDQAKMLTGAGTWVSLNGTFRGGVGGASVPATETAAGDWYYITSAGTSQSKTWAVGDRAVYNGSSGSWTQVGTQAPYAYNAPSAISAAGNTNLALGAGQSQRVEKISVSAGSAAFTHTLTIQSTNAVAGCEIEGQVSVAASCNPLVELRNLTSGGTLLGAITGDTVARVWDFRARFDGTNWFLTALAKQRGASIDELNAMVNGRAPAQGIVLDGTAAIPWNGTAIASGEKVTFIAFVNFSSLANDPRLFAKSDSSFQILVSSVGVPTLYTAGGSATGPSIAAGEAAMLAFVVNGNNTATVYTNGIAGAPAAISSSIGASDYMAGLSASSNVFTGYFRPYILNRAMTAGEILAAYESGTLPASDYNNASNTSILLSAWLNSDYTSFTGASATGFTAVAASGTKYGTSSEFNYNKGERIRLTGTLTLNAGKTVKPTFYLLNQLGSQSETPAGAGAFDFTFVSDRNQTTGGCFVVNTTGDANYTLSNMSVTRLGAIFAPEENAPGNGFQLKDMSGNKNDITLPVTGCAWALPDRRPNSVRGTLTWAGGDHLSKVLLGQRTLPNEAVVTQITTKATAGSSGSGLTIYNAPATVQWVNTNTFTTAKKVHTLARQIPNSTSDNDTTVIVGPDSANYTGSIAVELHYNLAEGTP